MRSKKTAGLCLRRTGYGHELPDRGGICKKTLSYRPSEASGAYPPREGFDKAVPGQCVCGGRKRPPYGCGAYLGAFVGAIQESPVKMVYDRI